MSEFWHHCSSQMCLSYFFEESGCSNFVHTCCAAAVYSSVSLLRIDTCPIKKLQTAGKLMLLFKMCVVASVLICELCGMPTFLVIHQRGSQRPGMTKKKL